MWKVFVVAAIHLAMGVWLAADPPATDTAPAGAAAQDPTQTSASLQAFLNASEHTTARSAEGVLPSIVRRAYIEVDGRPPEAILDIGGMGLLTVREGSSATLRSANGGAVTVRIARLTADETQIEIPATGATFVVR